MYTEKNILVANDMYKYEPIFNWLYFYIQIDINEPLYELVVWGTGLD